MSGIEVERCLATLYTDAGIRKRFLQDPGSVLTTFRLTDDERSGLMRIDLAGLSLAGDFYGAKRAKYVQWMHQQVQSFHCYKNLLEPAWLSQADVELGTGQTSSFSSEVAESAKIDLIPAQDETPQNREYLLDEADGLAAVKKIWGVLRGSALKNHQLLYLFASRGGALQEVSLVEESNPAGTYRTYVPLLSYTAATGAFGRWSIDVCLGAAGCQAATFMIDAGGCAIVPAHLKQTARLNDGGGFGGLLVFGTLASVQ